MTDSHRHDASSQRQHPLPAEFPVKVRRQDGPGQDSYWQTFKLRREPEMNVISVLQRIAARPVTADGKQTTPVAWDCNCLEEVCGSCTMVINGRVRQSCSALVDRILGEGATEIELTPMTKFPVLRDLVVDRTRMFDALTKVRAWIPVDGYSDMGPGPLHSESLQARRYPQSQCMSCGCCLEACPQYIKIELERHDGETDEAFEARKRQANAEGFIGAAAISQAMLFNSHPTGHMNADERTEALMAPGGIQACGNAQNCVAVCPKEIPLTTAIGRAGRATTVRAIKKFFGAS